MNDRPLRSPCDSWPWFDGRRVVPEKGPLGGAKVYRKTALVRAVQMPEPAVHLDDNDEWCGCEVATEVVLDPEASL